MVRFTVELVVVVRVEYYLLIEPMYFQTEVNLKPLERKPKGNGRRRVLPSTNSTTDMVPANKQCNISLYSTEQQNGPGNVFRQRYIRTNVALSG